MAEQRNSPYQGLNPYTVEDRDLFVGREDDTEFIAANVLTHRLTVLYGESGVGKTSLLQAGVAPALGEAPKSLAVVFRDWLTPDYPEGLRRCVAAELHRKSLPVPNAADLVQFLSDAAEFVDLFLIFDQFEDYFFTRGERGWLDQALARILRVEELAVSIVLSVRSDTLYLLDALQDRIPHLFANSIRVEHLTVEDGRRAIETPLMRYKEVYAEAARQRLKDPPIEAGLPDLILAGVAAGQFRATQLGRQIGPDPEAHASAQGIETAFLQIVLSRLWEEESKGRSIQLRIKTLRDTLKGVPNIALDYVRERIGAVADEISKQRGRALQDDVLQLCSLLFDRLVASSGRSVPYSTVELKTVVPSALGDLVPEVLVLLVRYRVLKPASPSTQPGPPMYEMMHDVLGEAVIRWQTEYRQKLQVRQELQHTEQTAKTYSTRFWTVLTVLIVLIIASTLAISLYGERLAAKQLRERADTLDTMLRQRDQDLRESLVRAAYQMVQIGERDTQIAELQQRLLTVGQGTGGTAQPLPAVQPHTRRTPMLQSIDVLIGLTVVMLMVSMAVTMLTQAVTSLLQSRGKHLLEGIMQLIMKIDPGLEPKISRDIARAVLTHPLIRGPRGLGTVIHREELIGILLELAGPSSTLKSVAEERLYMALRMNGIADPQVTLRSIRQAALLIERKAPELANHVRSELAIVQTGSSDFVATVHAWFDSTMDRVSERFTFSARLITFASALIVAGLVQLDTIGLINRLAMHDALRDALSIEAQAIAKAQTDPNAAAKSAAQREYTRVIEQTGIVLLPQSKQQWLANWQTVNPLGIALSALLLTLGAPFWYDTLKRLINLRPVLAAQDDQQRRDRQRTTTKLPEEVLSSPVPTTVPPDSSSLISGNPR